MFGAETLDHIAIPVRDLERAEKFYFETLRAGLDAARSKSIGQTRPL